MAGGEFARDPVSVLFDAPARRLLTRAYAARGQWVQTRLVHPSAAHRAWAASMGIDLSGADNAATLNGTRQNARSRWARGFVRSVHYQHKWYYSRGELRPAAGRRMTPASRPIEVQVGRAVPASPQAGGFPAGRAVRVRVRPGGKAARAAVEAKPESVRIWTDDGKRGGRFSDATARDW